MSKDIPPAGLYVHIPFCVKKCLYCDFCSYPGRLGLMDGYIARVLDETANAGDFRALCCDTLYLGGGTPSLMTPAQAQRLIGGLRSLFDVSRNAEVTMEVNPGTVDYDKLKGFADAGVNRLSVGAQSINDGLLLTLGRVHTAAQFFKTMEWATALFTNISADMMTGLPGQTVNDVASTARALIDSGVTHLSAYSLQVEEGTPFAAMNLDLPGEEAERDMVYAADDVLNSAGFTRYEVSNWAKPGYTSRHNLKYWTGADYLGLGPSAHSFLRTGETALRFANKPDLDHYMAGGERRVTERLNKAGLMEEYLMLRLRLSSGIDFDDYNSRFGGDFAAQYAPAIKKCANAGLITVAPTGIAPTRRGFDLQNSLAVEFISSIP